MHEADAARHAVSTLSPTRTLTALMQGIHQRRGGLEDWRQRLQGALACADSETGVNRTFQGRVTRTHSS
jgi:hypothetical protein